MAYLKAVNEPYRNLDAVKKLVHYIVDGGLYVGSATTSTNPDECIAQMYRIKELYGKLGGRQIRQFILTFNCKYECIMCYELEYLGAQIAAYYDSTYQVIWAIHEGLSEDGDLLRHIHFVFNTVSYIDGRMYRGGIDDIVQLAAFISARLPEDVAPLKWGYERSNRHDYYS